MVWHIGKTSMYSSQRRPMCAAGEQPEGYTYPETAIELLACSPCPVGTYKPQYGDINCIVCDEGMGKSHVGLLI